MHTGEAGMVETDKNERNTTRRKEMEEKDELTCIRKKETDQCMF